MYYRPHECWLFAVAILFTWTNNNNAWGYIKWFEPLNCVYTKELCSEIKGWTTLNDISWQKCIWWQKSCLICSKFQCWTVHHLDRVKSFRIFFICKVFCVFYRSNESFIRIRFYFNFELLPLHLDSIVQTNPPTMHCQSHLIQLLFYVYVDVNVYEGSTMNKSIWEMKNWQSIRNCLKL